MTTELKAGEAAVVPASGGVAGGPCGGWLQRLWQAFRQLTGDNAYERYLQHQHRHHDGEPLSRAEFFKLSQRRKWEGVRRCC
jgi:uncharacterized short protein YbdD (DUF466 family)